MDKEFYVKRIIEEILKKVVVKAIAKVPFLGLPIINPIFLFIAEKIISLASDELQLLASTEWDERETELKLDAYNQALKELQSVIKDGTSDPKMSIEEYKSKLANLIRFPSR